MTSVESNYTDCVEAIAIAAHWFVHTPVDDPQRDARLHRLVQALENWTEDYGYKEGTRDQEPEVKKHYMQKRREKLNAYRDKLAAAALELGEKELARSIKKC